MKMFVVNLVLDLPLFQTYSYLSPNPVARGVRVTVEFGHREQVAFVINSIPASEFNAYPVEKLKPLLSISSAEFSLPPELLNMIEFTASYYHYPLGSTLFCAIPVLLRKTGNPSSNLTPLAEYYRAGTTEAKLRSRKHQQLLDQLQKHSLSTSQIQQFLGKNPKSILTAWLASGIIQIAPRPDPAGQHAPLQLNPQQQEIVGQLQQSLHNFQVGVLYGITGSGKTEVFLQVIAAVLAQKRQVLVLVPEINLTPQLATRFNERFPAAQISIINSEVSNKQRLESWLAAKSGQTQIILGTRLSVFTPCANLGLIIVDEEHDDSFKQNDSLRYHARDLAIWRAKQIGIPITLSSATPSLETLYNYKLGKYTLYKLTNRAVKDAKLPTIELINLQHNPLNFAGISQIALDKLKLCLKRQELALVFINRRGYAPIITCYDCGWISSCRYCSSKMVYHHDRKQLKCHHCGHQTQVPPACPLCHNQYLHTLGHGTQKLEEFLGEQFPTARIRRVDRDSTASKAAWQDLYQKINEIDILVGTQMLAKGHDFARLTLVVGLNLDNALFSYDFRASELMFNTLTQVSGRAGRAAEPGLVMLQTNYPTHPLYQFLQQHDFNGFINYTLKERKQNSLPPFTFYALVKISAINEAKLNANLKKLKMLSQQISHPEELRLFPPVPAVMYKLHNKFRGQMLIISHNRSALHAYLSALTPLLANLAACSIAIDVDPLEL